MPRKDNTDWLSEGLDAHEVLHSGTSGSSMMSKLTSPPQRISATQKIYSRPTYTDLCLHCCDVWSVCRAMPKAGQTRQRRRDGKFARLAFRPLFCWPLPPDLAQPALTNALGMMLEQHANEVVTSRKQLPVIWLNFMLMLPMVDWLSSKEGR